jgi:ubiquinone/menaquinone biosynthesis C-methylase UbiE
MLIPLPVAWAFVNCMSGIGLVGTLGICAYLAWTQARKTPRVRLDESEPAWDASPRVYGPMKLLPLESLLRTGPVDHGDWSYRRTLGWLMWKRYRLVQALLPAKRVGSVLEIGYGSGIFLPELAKHCETLQGIDVHAFNEAVTAKLREHDITAMLVSGSAEDLPYADRTFDCLVALSSLEFIPDIRRAASEMCRVLRPNGRLIFVTPASNPLVDAALRILTGESAKKDFEERREQLMPALNEYFTVERQHSFPAATSSCFSLYWAYRMTRRSPGELPVRRVRRERLGNEIRTAAFRPAP